MAKTNTWGHSSDGKECGENLYYKMKSDGIGELDAEIPINAWYNEIKDYDFKAGKSKSSAAVGLKHIIL